MYKKSLLFIISLFIVFISCHTTKSTTRKTKNSKLENSLLWKISGNGLKKPSYLYGTIHLTCNYMFTDKLKKAFDETDQLVLELNMSDPNLQAEMMKYIFMEDSNTIKDLLNEEDYKTLATFFKEQVGMDLILFNRMKPLAITSALTAKMVAYCDTPTAYETEFMKVTKEQNEKIVGLETVEDQMKVFDKIPYKEQLKSLVEMAEKGEDASMKDFQEMTNYYENEDLEGLLTVLSKQGLEGDFQENLVDQRNRNWIPLITKITHEKPSFIGVGALHLPGTQGVINLLKQEGFTVEAVY